MTNKAILKAIDEGHLVVAPFSKESLFHTSYNIRLGQAFLYEEKRIKEFDLKNKKNIILNPLSYILCRSLEKFKVDYSIHGILGGKSNLLVKGLIIANGLTIDPSFEGYLEFGIFNATNKKVKLSFKEPIAKVVFFDVSNIMFEDKWLPKREKKKWDLRKSDKVVLKEMEKIYYQGE
jgi:deoxycytidine triphosphate deaminase